jgi:hypothetical protein
MSEPRSSRSLRVERRCLRRSVLFPLTPALSLREREILAPTLVLSKRSSLADHLPAILPLPEEKGRSEGEDITSFNPHA